MKTKKYFLIAALLFSTFTLKAQRATLENNTAKYIDRSFGVADTITLGYGSKADKGFAFISIGSSMTGVTDLEKEWSKNEAVIEKLYLKGKTVYIRAKLVNKTINALGGNKLFIDLEGAIDNKELK